MRTIRRFTCNDLFTFNAVNLDFYTETVRITFLEYPANLLGLCCLQRDCKREAECLQYHIPFYLDYLARWPEYCLMAEGAHGQAMGYIIGKVEGEGQNWHGHITAVTIAPEYRSHF